MFYTIAGIVFFATLAMMVQHGVWSNLISLIAIVIGGITAFGVHQPLTILIDEKTGGSYTYLLDFFVLWLTFAIVTGVLKEIAARLSKNRVNFPEQVDNFGGAAIGAFTAYVMVCFAMATFHAAPLGYDLFGSAYEFGVSPDEAKKNIDDKFAPMAPTVAWLRLCESVLSPDALGGAGFSPEIFVSQHGKHRQTNQAMDTGIVKRS
ncbi:Colicin V production protein [Botrimarina colliarenosi]|uniref:Colicin V production protein n=1 Tax=Botrimarina colliarenosi TaxID=2528001 RepID=A0A5C6AC25_9BACT|nr:CvpA family protein [Botrimarina colliarenosi]TWT96966.1 Colicin V production protein [Botrimarina colliarenosi]